MSIVSQLEFLLASTALTRQDVLELTECVIQTYLTQQQSHNDDDNENEQLVNVTIDDDGDLVDKEGYIYDPKLHIRIGEKDQKTKEKKMYTVV